MNVIELQTEDNNKNLNYIENGIKSYIKNNHYNIINIYQLCNQHMPYSVLSLVNIVVKK